MNNLRKLGAAFVLICVLGLSALAGETSTPCPPPDPGETSTPCSSAQLSAYDPSIPDPAVSQPASSDVELVAFEAAKYAIESMLAVF